MTPVSRLRGSPAARREATRTAIEGHLDALTTRLRRDAIEGLVAAFDALDPDPEGPSRSADAHLTVLLAIVPRLVEDLAIADREDARRLAELKLWLDRIVDPAGVKAAMRDYLAETVTDPVALRGDLAAVDRHLHLDALSERVARKVEARAIQLEILVKMLASVAEARRGWEPLRPMVADGAPVVVVLSRALVTPRWQTTRASIVACSAVARSRGEFGMEPWPTDWLGALRARIADPEEHFAVGHAAIRATRDWDAVTRLRTLREVLDPGSDAHILVRRCAVELVGECPEREVLPLLEMLVAEPDRSEHVRMGLAVVVLRFESIRSAIVRLASAPEPSAKVRAVAIAEWLRVVGKASAPVGIEAALAAESESLVLEIACETMSARCSDLARELPSAALGVARAFEVMLTGIARRDLPPPVLEACAVARERLRAVLDPVRAQLVEHLRPIVEAIVPGALRRVPWTAFPREVHAALTDTERLAPVLAELSRESFGLTASVDARGLLLTRGDHFQPRLWRMLHEVRARAPNKRQAYSHVRGRRLRGLIRAHPGGLDEVTATTVPGERVTIDREGSWARHVPTVDDLLDLPVLVGRPAIVASSHGLTRVLPPETLAQRLRARLRLTRSYARFAALRLAALRGIEPSERRAYVDAVRRELGIRMELTPYERTEPLPKHLASVLAPEAHSSWMLLASGATAVGAMLERAEAYLTTPEHNSQPALALFSGALLSWMMLRSYRAKRRIEKARASVPLSIGGWGTRGKSGTERIKAGLFHGLGYQVLVKTTGCEAMFIHSVPGQRPLEVFIYRPYDKATIWEQAKLVELASRVKAQVFLWECMALNPRYVELLAHEWMRDDLNTLTNAFPDHEDIQGPAGQDVAGVISRFIPNGGTCFTTEVNFLPLFEQRAKELGTTLIPVSRREADLMADDVLELFPYQEHPRNIALVARMAEHLGIERDVAIGLMAENVVPDLGVLKTYGDVVLRGRRLRFMNGMSANERTGCVSNWRRMKLDRIDVDREPHETVVTVVNNRDDRVARSEVFGRILVEDLAADRHVLIGTNIGGLVGYATAALDRFVPQIEVLEAGSTQGSPPEERLARWLARVRVPLPTVETMLERLSLGARGASSTLRSGVSDALRPILTRWLGPARGSTTSLASVRAELLGDQDLKRLLAEAYEPSALPAFEGHPEILAAATADEAREAFLHVLGRIVVHARLRANLPVERSPSAIGAFHAELRAAYRELFLETLVPVHDPKTTGDQIIDLCARGVAPGTRLTIMGIQNIKGTGLDFAYRWVALGAMTDGLRELQSSNAARRGRAFADLEAFGDHGLLDAGLGRLRIAEHGRTAATEAERARARALAQKLEGIFEGRRAKLGSTSKGGGGVRARVLHAVERMADYLDAVRRAREARQVIDDLVDERIAIARASLVLRQLTGRQKGGWLLPSWRG